MNQNSCMQLKSMQSVDIIITMDFVFHWRQLHICLIVFYVGKFNFWILWLFCIGLLLAVRCNAHFSELFTHRLKFH
jgi:hypothetical protein